MRRTISACGVLCSACPAYHGDRKGAAHQQRTIDAWRRIYGLEKIAENIRCGGCLGPDDQLFHTSGKCEARRCCRSKGFTSCAECPVEQCPLLEKAQSVWDEVPTLAKKLSREDFVTYAKPYCNHRQRLDALRGGFARKDN